MQHLLEQQKQFTSTLARKTRNQTAKNRFAASTQSRHAYSSQTRLYGSTTSIPRFSDLFFTKQIIFYVGLHYFVIVKKIFNLLSKISIEKKRNMTKNKYFFSFSIVKDT